MCWDSLPCNIKSNPSFRSPSILSAFQPIPLRRQQQFIPLSNYPLRIFPLSFQDGLHVQGRRGKAQRHMAQNRRKDNPSSRVKRKGKAKKIRYTSQDELGWDSERNICACFCSRSTQQYTYPLAATATGQENGPNPRININILQDSDSGGCNIYLRTSPTHPIPSLNNFDSVDCDSNGNSNSLPSNTD